MPIYSISIKEVKTPEAFMELARTVDGFLFDEVLIKKISFVPEGRSIEFSYVRNAKRVDGLTPLTVSAEDFRASAQIAQQQGSSFAKTPVAERLFADGARQYTEKNRPAVADAMADAEFIDSLQS